MDKHGVIDVFVLEDDPERVKWFKMTFGSCNIVCTKDIKTACDELRTKDYDLIFLDRDLGYPRGQSGEDVAWTMKEEELVKDGKVVIHTVNPHGQKAMRRYLDKYHNNIYVIPFPQLIKMKLEDFGIET